MDTIGPVVRLDDQDDMRGIKLIDEWRIDAAHDLVRYLPGSLIFRIIADAPTIGLAPNLMELSAQLVHVCDGETVPPLPDLILLAKDAIHAFYIETGGGYDDEIPF